jgi:pimeloyl-ACP methyl ester carboxylesterase
MKSLILLHGALGTKDQMQSLAKILSDQFRTYTFDFSGHGGRSDITDPFSMELMTEDLHDFIKQNAIQDPLIFGYSMGGYVALYHALKYPSIISAIITLATKFDWSVENAEREVSQLNIDLMKEKIPDFVEVLKSRHGKHWEKTIENTRELMLQLSKTKQLHAESLSKIQTKALICIGDKDKMVSLSESEQAAGNLVNATLHILPNTPHPFERVSLELLTQIISEFEQGS